VVPGMSEPQCEQGYGSLNGWIVTCSKPVSRELHGPLRRFGDYASKWFPPRNAPNSIRGTCGVSQYRSGQACAEAPPTSRPLSTYCARKLVPQKGSKK
jgi:hypothetical protein